MTTAKRAISVLQATQNSPALARLGALATESGERLRAIETMLPAALRTAVLPGPIEETTWCIIVEHSAAAAKLRQLAPALITRLNALGWDIQTIRIKVLGQSKT
jgi:hypothetical protein